MSHSLPLLAAGDWIGIVVFLVILIISAISQAIGNKKEAPPPRPNPRPRPPMRPAQAGPPPHDPVAAELEEFLRRAGGGTVGRPPAHTQAPPPVPQPVMARPVETEMMDDLEVIENVADHSSHSVGTHYESQVGRSQPQGVGAAERFEHQMGQFSSTSNEAAYAAARSESEKQDEFLDSLPSTAAAGLAALLASPGDLRQAILLSEILGRPEHRWT